MKHYFLQYKTHIAMFALIAVALAFGWHPDPALAAAGLFALTTAPFPVQPELTAIAIGYRNENLIADEVLPRVIVGKQEFKYQKYAMQDGFTLPDTKVGRKSKPNEVDFSATEQTASTSDYGLDDPIPQADVNNAAPGQNPLGRATMNLTDLILLDREKRVADLVFDAGQYAAANKITLSGSSQWSDYANSNPIDAILAALDGCIMRPNVFVMGQAVWTKLRQHPRVVKAVLGNAGDSGVAARQAVADLLEIEQILVGQGWLNTARKGQPVAMQRVWGKSAALLYRDKLADPAGNRTTFGFTAQFGSRIAGATPDRDIGLRGGQRVRAGESVKEVICASDLGYFIANAVA